MVNKRDIVSVVFQIVQLTLAGAILLTGVVEFSVEPPIFDVLGKKGERPSIPPDVFEVCVCVCVCVHVNLPHLFTIQNVSSNSIGAQV